MTILFKAKFHYAVQLASRSQTSSRPNSITLSSLRPAHEQVCDQLASWFASCRPASEQDSIMKYGLNRHVEIARTCLRQVGNQVCDLDSVMEFAKFHYAI